MPDPLTIASVIIGVLCLLAIGLLTFVLFAAIVVMLGKNPSAKSWRSLRKTVKQQEEADAADAQWRAAGRGLGYDTDSLASE